MWTSRFIPNTRQSIWSILLGFRWYYKNTGVNGRTLFGHNGGDIGVTTEMFISELDDIGVIILTNSSNYNAIIQIENAIFDFVEESNFIINGDVNYDNIVNILDIVLIY